VNRDVEPGRPVIPPDLSGLPPRGDDLVTLRAWRQSDLPVIAEAGQDPYIPLITTIPARYTPQDGQAFLRRQWDQAAEGRGYPLAIAAATTGDVVGMATLTGINWTHRRAGIGYWVLSRHRGHGYATAAAALLPGIARDIGLVRIEALIEPDNVASQAVCRAAGLLREGLLRSYYRIGSANRDMLIFGMVL
jgi:RimJ/RimL family protein N-acetyltransferase